jgi:alkylglycerol monooxygenase
MTPGQIIVLATPVFFGLITIEFAWGWRQARKGGGRNSYRLNDAINSLGLGLLSQVSAVFTRLLRIGIYTAIYASVALYPDEAFWTSWYGWLLALVFYDFCYYWLHRAGHESAVFWAAHVVHHQSQDYNLSTALRQTSSGSLLGWIFYLPMAVAGVPPLVFAVVALVDLLYQFWVHTEHIPKLGWFDRWFCSPSNHRVHHAVNDHYLDRNYGGILIVWDRLFGTFREEGERCVYGTRSPLNSWDPLWANAEVYCSLLEKSWQARRWSDKLRYWLKPPGWRPHDAPAAAAGTAFDAAKLQIFHPPMSRTAMWFAAAQFFVLLQGAALFLWFAEGLPLAQSALCFGVLTAGLWAVGAVTQGRIGMLEALLIETAALASATSAAGLGELHHILKPLAMAIALFFVACRARSSWTRGTFYPLLLLALGCSLAGDVLLMFPGHFLAGLVAFLMAHLAYIALFKQGLAWFPSRPALAATLLTGTLIYAFLWAGLPPDLRLAVAVYVVVIALMAAQAIGRALVLQGKAAIGVAAGACFFMLSDSLLALDRFTAALPMASLWVLGTYYTAQILIARHAQPSLAAQGSEPANKPVPV